MWRTPIKPLFQIKKGVKPHPNVLFPPKPMLQSKCKPFGELNKRGQPRGNKVKRRKLRKFKLPKEERVFAPIKLSNGFFSSFFLNLPVLKRSTLQIG